MSTATTLSPPKVSVAIALHNEQEVLPELLRRLTNVLDQLPGGPHEVVFIDDGSTDRTFDLISEASARDPRVVGISLSRNFGHQAALSAGLENVTGDVVVLMDGDLQDRPEEIPRFLDAYEAGFDVVYADAGSGGRRAGRFELPTSCSTDSMAKVSNLRMPLDSGDFGLLSRRVVDRINALPERNRYLRGLRAWVGFPQIGIPVQRDPRAAGRPSYNLGKLMRLAADGIFAFSIAPLRAAALLGALTTAGAALFAAYSIFIRVVLGESPQGFTGRVLIVAIIFFSGIQLMFLGLIGEYLGRVYDEAKGRPHYIVSAVVGQRTVATRADLEVAFRGETSRLERIG